MTPRPPLALRPLTERDRPAFVRLVTAAFAADPLFVKLFGERGRDDSAESRTAAFAGFLFDKSRLLREEAWGAVANGSICGICVTAPEGGTARGRIRGYLHLLPKVAGLFRRLPFDTVFRLNDYYRLTQAAAPDEAHRYVILLAVDPASQGAGIGRLLLRRALERTACAVAALDTANPTLLPWYEADGFRLARTVHLDGLPIYCLVRDLR